MGGHGELGSKSVVFWVFFPWHVKCMPAVSKNTLVWRWLFFWCMGNIGFLMSIWWLGKKSQRNASETAQINKPVLLLFVQCLTEGWYICFYVFSSGPYCFAMLLRTCAVINHLQSCLRSTPSESQVAQQENYPIALGPSEVSIPELLEGKAP